VESQGVLSDAAEMGAANKTKKEAEAGIEKASRSGTWRVKKESGRGTSQKKKIRRRSHQ
jgi:hypothetical protein